MLDTDDASEAVTADNLLINEVLRAESTDLRQTAAEEFDKDEEELKDMKDERTMTTRKANNIQTRIHEVN